MKRFLLISTILVAIPTSVLAVESVSLSLRTSSAPNPLQLTVGEQETILVELAGLPSGVSLDSLAATITFDGSLLGMPVIKSGAIVPSPLADPLDLLATTDTGLADVAFLTLGTIASDHIQTDGIFFSFDVTAAQIGTGAFHFDFAGATAFNAANPNSPLPVSVIVGADLPFSVVAVPEPGSVVLCCLFAFAPWIGRRMR